MLTKEKLTVFFEIIELRTKIASFFPILIGYFYAWLRFGEFNAMNSFVFFIAVLVFDMFTTALNNTLDYKKAISDDYKANENVIGIFRLSYKQVRNFTFSLLVIAIIFSLFLVTTTNLIILPIGVLCFLIGISYTFGPIPISRTPFGEFFSSITMGFGIIFLAVFVQNPENLLTMFFSQEIVLIQWQWLNTLEIFLLALPIILLISNIMLANNIRDLEMDILNERKTLVYYLGQERAHNLYLINSLLVWVFIILNIIISIFPWYAVFAIVFSYFHYQSVNRYLKDDNKNRAFKEAIQSFILISVVYLLIMISWLVSTIIL